MTVRNTWSRAAVSSTPTGAASPRPTANKCRIWGRVRERVSLRGATSVPTAPVPPALLPFFWAPSCFLVPVAFVFPVSLFAFAFVVFVVFTFFVLFFSAFFVLASSTVDDSNESIPYRSIRAVISREGREAARASAKRFPLNRGSSQNG